MRLEYVCDLELGYRETGFAVVRPYGGEEGSGYGELDGAVSGGLRGVVRAVNHPHRRSDGAMLPDLHGLIETADGALLTLRLQGRTVFGADGRGRQTLTVAFETADARYRWLNDAVCAYEGVIAMPVGRGRVYACVNELP